MFSCQLYLNIKGGHKGKLMQIMSLINTHIVILFIYYEIQVLPCKSKTDYTRGTIQV